MLPPQKIFGSILLVAGCCIGAGMLGLPLLTAKAGFYPSIVVLFFSWLFMLLTGLLLLEVNLWFSEELNFVSLARGTLGPFGAYLSWGLYLFLFYSLMVAYVSATGSFVQQVGSELFSVAIPQWVGLSFVALLFGLSIYRGVGNVDLLNRSLMLILGIAYFAMIVAGSNKVSGQLLSRADWGQTLWIAPAMVVSFGYHNLIPSLVSYLQRDRKQLTKVVFWGSLLPFLGYVIWQGLILGVIPFSIMDQYSSDQIITQSLARAGGGRMIVAAAEVFAFSALLTSYLAVAMSFLDFLADGFAVDAKGSKRLSLVLAVLLPPSITALVYPNIFLKSLAYAGAFGAVILFGVLPVLMALKGRGKNQNHPRLVPGGMVTLFCLLGFSLAVFFLQFYLEWSS